MLIICTIFIISTSVDIHASSFNIIPNKSKRIIGGRDTTIEEHPYQVAIEHDDGNYLCSGAIISQNYVLTAAHCINDTIEKEIKIRSGSSFREKGGTLHDVVKMTAHELYSIKDGNELYDIGVVHVKQPFVYSATRQPIALNKVVASSNYSVEEKLIVSGWGHVDRQGNIANQLQTMEVSWVTKYSCNHIHKKFGGIYEGQICAGYAESLGKDICYGDSGSPLIFENKVIGVAACTVGECGLYNYPTVYTEVAYFIDWLNKNVEF